MPVLRHTGVCNTLPAGARLQQLPEYFVDVVNRNNGCNFAHNIIAVHLK